MITIRRNGPCDLSAVGHGEKLVCAAVSALMLTLGANVSGLQAEGLLEGRKISLISGNSCIACRPKKGVAPAVELLFDGICQGFAVLQTLYPHHIRFERKDI